MTTGQRRGGAGPRNRDDRAGVGAAATARAAWAAWAAWTTAGAAAVLATSLPTARAYEDQATLDLGLGYAHAFASGLPASGAAVALGGSLGLGDVWTLRATLGWAAHPAAATGPPTTHVLTGGVELLYVVDVLRWVPYVGAGVDAVGTVSEAGSGVDLAAHAVLGLEWLASRAWLLGVDVRPYLLLSDAFASAPRFPVYLTVTVKAGVVLDL
jgi:hypothetical protein